MTTPAKNGNGFAQKLIFGALAILVAYLGWLGVAVYGIGREVSAMKANVDRLVAARDAEEMQRSARTSDRLDAVENTGRPQP